MNLQQYATGKADVSNLIGVTKAPLLRLPEQLKSPMGRRNLNKFTKSVVPFDYLCHKQRDNRQQTEAEE